VLSPPQRRVPGAGAGPVRGGEVLAADTPSEELERLLDEAGPTVTAAGEHRSREPFRAEPAQLREQGHGVASRERVPGTASIAAPSSGPTAAAPARCSWRRTS
jgi:DNA-binding IclR family transcriptional regulator